MTWYEVLTDLQSGKCAMAIDAPSLATWIADGEDSVAKGHINVSGPVYVDKAEDAKSIIFGWNLGLNANSKNKEAAWYFIQYCTGALRQSSGSRLAFPTRKFIQKPVLPIRNRKALQGFLHQALALGVEG